jgi:hypothetical protein
LMIDPAERAEMSDIHGPAVSRTAELRLRESERVREAVKMAAKNGADLESRWMRVWADQIMYDEDGEVEHRVTAGDRIHGPGLR